MLGAPICASECTSRQLRISFARLLIEMDVTQELPKSISIQDPSGSVFYQEVTYDWVPPFCKSCNVVGHNCELRRKGNKQPAGAKKWVPKQPAMPKVPGNPGPVVPGSKTPGPFPTSHTVNPAVVQPIDTKGMIYCCNAYKEVSGSEGLDY